MNIFAVTEFDKPFVYLSTGLAFENLSAHLDATVILIDHTNWWDYMVHKPTHQFDIIVCEAVYLELNKISIKQLRHYYPNAKIVVLGSDTIYYTTTGKNGGYQFDSPLEVDLFLDQMTDVIDEYQNRGITVDRWKWTIAEKLIEHLTKFEQTPWEDREYDFIGVYAPHTIAREGSYRQKMVNYIQNHGYKFTQGGGTGHNDQDFNKIFRAYCNSKVTLGTTSHDNPAFHGVKGFRDWIAPFVGNVLIYDDYKDIVDHYKGGLNIPLYPYGDFKRVIDIRQMLDNNLYRNHLIAHQKAWALENTIEKQLVRLFKKHGII